MADLKFGVMGWTNVMSFGQVRQEVDLSVPGTVHIIGENLDDGGSSGAGKTTIMNILCWLLWDKVPSGISKDRLINTTNDAKKVMMTGELNMWSGSDHYLIKKTRGSANTIHLFKNEKDETPASVAAFNAKLEEIVGYSFELFSQLVIFNGSAVPFLDLPARDQREMIEELFKITLLSRKAEKLKEMIKENDGQLKLTTALYQQAKEKYGNDLTKYEADLVATNGQFERWGLVEHQRIKTELVSAIEILAVLKTKAASWSEQEQLRLAEILVDTEDQVRAFDQQEQSGYADRVKNAEMNVSGFNAKLSRLRDELKATEEATPERIAGLAELDANHRALAADLRQARSEQASLSPMVTKLQNEITQVEKQIEHLAANNCPFCMQAYADAISKVAELEAMIAKKGAELAVQLESLKAATEREGDLLETAKRLPTYNAVEHQRLQKLYESKSTLEAELGRVTADQVQKKTELDYLKANPDSKRPNPWIDRAKAAELAISAFNPQNNPFVGQVAVAEQKHADALAATVDSSKNPYATQLEYLAANEPQKPSTDVEKELNALVKMKDHQGVLLKLLTDKNSFIRKGIIGKTMPFLNKRIAYYTQRLGLPHIVNFMPDLSTEITQMGRVLDHGNLSNGEKQRLNFSLCLSFRDALTYLHSRINLLVTDEIDGGKLDEQGINNIISLIKHKSWDDKLAIFNISHSPFFDGRCDRTLVVRKEGGFSRIIKQLES
jgi:DNA repair exonuclease SbcCD ATPase subunit